MLHIFCRLDLSIKTFHDIFLCDLCYQIDLCTIIQCLVVMKLFHVLYIATRICQKYNKLLTLWVCDNEALLNKLFLVREKPPPPHCCIIVQVVMAFFLHLISVCWHSIKAAIIVGHISSIILQEPWFGLAPSIPTLLGCQLRRPQAPLPTAVAACFSVCQ